MEITKLVPKEKRGLVLIITGNGKGKTTTALGIAVRACGYNMRVCIIQFMKGDLYSGEWSAYPPGIRLKSIMHQGKIVNW